MFVNFSRQNYLYQIPLKSVSVFYTFIGVFNLTKKSWLILIGIVILGLGLIIAMFSSSTSYSRQAPIKGPIINIGTSTSGVSLVYPGAPIGDGYAIFSGPGTLQMQLPNYPYKFTPFSSPSGSSVFIGGFFVASDVVNFSITSLLPGSPVIFNIQNVQAVGFLFPNFYFPWFFKMEWENSNNIPVIIMGETLAIDPIIPMFKPLNPLFIFAIGLIAFGLFILFVSLFETKMENEKSKLQKLNGSFSEILSFSLTTWKSIFSRVSLPFAILIALQVIIISVAENLNRLVIFELNTIVNPIYSPIHRNYNLLQLTLFFTPICYYLVALFSFLLPLIAMGTVIKYTHNHITGNRATIKESLKNAVKYSGKLLSASIFLILILIAGLLVFVAPGIYLTVTLSLIMQVIIIEKTNILKAISRSIYLTQGKKLETLYLIAFGSILIFLTFLLVYLITSILVPTIPPIITFGDYFSASSTTSIVNFLPSIIGIALIVGALIATTIPFISIIMTVWYTHLNNQKSQTPQAEKEGRNKVREGASL